MASAAVLAKMLESRCLVTRRGEHDDVSGRGGCGGRRRHDGEGARFQVRALRCVVLERRAGCSASMKMNGTGWVLFPIFETEAGHALEFACVVRDQHQGTGQGLTGDQCVIRADGCAG